MRTTIEHFLLWRAEEPGDGLVENLRWQLKALLIRMQPHLRVRYAPVLRHLRELSAAGGTPRVLEVGAGSLGITRFWHHPVTGVDLQFDGPKLPYLNTVRASAEALPFADGDFDVVICVDMLEHLTAEQRANAVSEMLRVARGEVLVGLPCGSAAERCEAWARERCSEALGRVPLERVAQVQRRSAFLSEHASCGIPSEADILDLMHAYAHRVGDQVHVTVFGNEPVWFWRLMLPGVVPFNSWSPWLSRAAGFILEPLLGVLPNSENYRRFFHAVKPAEGEAR